MSLPTKVLLYLSLDPCNLELLLLGASVHKQLKELSKKSWDPTSMTEMELESRIFRNSNPSSITELGQIIIGAIRGI